MTTPQSLMRSLRELVFPVSVEEHAFISFWNLEDDVRVFAAPDSPEMRNLREYYFRKNILGHQKFLYES